MWRELKWGGRKVGFMDDMVKSDLRREWIDDWMSGYLNKTGYEIWMKRNKSDKTGKSAE